MNQQVIDMLAMVNRAGRARRPNANMLYGLRDLYEESGSGPEVLEYLGAVCALAATVDNPRWVSVIQGRVWCTFSVYQFLPGPGIKMHPKSVYSIRRFVLGRCRYRRVRGEGKIEWQLRMERGRWVANRKVELLLPLVDARREGDLWTMRTDNVFPDDPTPGGSAELGDDVTDTHLGYGQAAA